MGKCILVVDDNSNNRYLARFLLEQQGYTVHEVADGESAVRLARERMPDLILMDIQMPGMDGLEATRRIRQHAPHQRVVALTAHAMTGDRERLMLAGCDGYIEKPIDPASFAATIAGYLPKELE